MDRKKYYKHCQILDCDGKKCSNSVFKTVEVFGDNKLYPDIFFKICICKKHYKEYFK